MSSRELTWVRVSSRESTWAHVSLRELTWVYVSSRELTWARVSSRDCDSLGETTAPVQEIHFLKIFIFNLKSPFFTYLYKMPQTISILKSVLSLNFSLSILICFIYFLKNAISSSCPKNDWRNFRFLFFLRTWPSYSCRTIYFSCWISIHATLLFTRLSYINVKV